ncbi:hypothetical protein I4U23_015844 [Adineta vaga]|nr:hypothetical protein I4U23_015844 [Adineta vaga]
MTTRTTTSTTSSTSSENILIYYEYSHNTDQLSFILLFQQRVRQQLQQQLPQPLVQPVTSTTSSTSATSTTTTTTTQAPTQLWSVSSRSGLISSYANFKFSWTALTTRNATIAFQMQNKPGYWYVDDVSVIAGGTEKLVNGGFETGSLPPWIRTTPNGACGGTAGSVTSSLGNGGAGGGTPKTGTYYVGDGSETCYDQVQQSFGVTMGIVYNISFWIKSANYGSSGPEYIAVVIL